MVYNFSTLGCIFRHNERQKKQNVAMLSSVALLPAKRKIAPAPLPPAVTRHPINPTTTIHMTFPEVVIEPAQPVVRKLKQSAIYRNVKLDKPEPAKTVRTYRCTLCKQPKTKSTATVKLSEVNGTAPPMGILWSGRSRTAFYEMSSLSCIISILLPIIVL